MSIFRETGYWWLPETPDKTVTGSVSFSPTEDIVLELIGTFRESVNTGEARKILRIPVIHGFTSKGQQITIFDVIETKANVHFPSNVTLSDYKSELMMVGGHFESIEKVDFDSISVNYHGIEGWARLTPHTFPEFTPFDGGQRVRCEYVIPNELKFDLTDFQISFESNVCHKDNPAFLDIEVQETTFVKIEPKIVQKFYDLWKSYFYHVQNFLALAMGIPAIPTKIKATIRESMIDLGDGKQRKKEIEVYKAINHNVIDVNKRPDFQTVLFYLPEIQHDFGTYFSNWILKSDKLKPVYDLFFGAWYNTSMYLQHKFLSLAHAIETYHRRCFPGAILDPTDWDKVKEQLVNDIPEELWKKLVETMPPEILKKVRAQMVSSVPNDIVEECRKALIQKLNHVNEVSLKTRLKEILKNVATFAQIGGWDGSAFVKNLADTRNYLTHYDQRLQDKSLTGRRLWDITQAMQTLIETCFLREMGFKDETIHAVLKRRAQFQGKIPMQ
jgi:hypothetical protein